MENKNIKPKGKAGLTIQDLGDEIILYDPEKEHVHVLNHTAQAIWNLCTGENTIDDMQDSLKKLFPNASDSELFDDLKTTINDFKAKNIIIY